MSKVINYFHQMDHVCVGRVVIQKFFGPNCSFSILLIDVWFDMHTHERRVCRNSCTKAIIWLTSNRGENLWDEAKGETLLRDFNGKKLITFFLLIILNLKEQRAVKWFDLKMPYVSKLGREYGIGYENILLLINYSNYNCQV